MICIVECVDVLCMFVFLLCKCEGGDLNLHRVGQRQREMCERDVIGGLEAWRLGGLEAWRLGGLEAWRLGGSEAWRLEGLEAWKDCKDCTDWKN